MLMWRDYLKSLKWKQLNLRTSLEFVYAIGVVNEEQLQLAVGISFGLTCKICQRANCVHKHLSLS